jgi:methionyl-tRNA formyltransferase
MRVVFFGTPAWAVPSLEALAGGDFDVAAVVCNPDKPSGRGMSVHAPPVKLAADSLGLPVRQPKSARDPEFRSWLEEMQPDVAVVVAYGKLLPPELLEVPGAGFVNVHFSLLPEYRGAAPVQRAIMEGKTSTGVSLMVLTEGMDEGPVVAVVDVEIEPEETAGELGARLAPMGADLLVRTLPGFVDGSVPPTPQDDEEATYAPKLTTDEARIEWTRPAGVIHDQIRGLNPAPGAWSVLKDRVKIWRARIHEGGPALEPGEIEVGAEVLVGTGEGVLALTEVQAAGKKKMSASDYARGLHLASPARFV